MTEIKNIHGIFIDTLGVDGKSFQIILNSPECWKKGDLLCYNKSNNREIIVVKMYYNWWRKILHKLGFKTKLFTAKVKSYV